MKKFAIFASMLLAFLSPLVAFAEEEKSEDFLFKIRGSFTSEVNFLDSGNARVFSNRDEAQDTIGPEDRKKSFWRNSMQLYLAGDIVKFWMNVYTNGDEFVKTAESAGVEASLLFSLDFLVSGLEAGFYHNSRHNFGDGRYGRRGDDITGLHIRFNFQEDNGWLFNIWGTHHSFKNRGSPYIFTKDFIEMSKEEWGTFKWAAGFTADNKKDNYRAVFSFSLAADDDNDLASARNRLEVFYKIKKPLIFGGFVEYDLNLKKRGVFGKDEWLVGPLLKLSF